MVSLMRERVGFMRNMVGCKMDDVSIDVENVHE